MIEETAEKEKLIKDRYEAKVAKIKEMQMQDTIRQKRAKDLR